MSGFLGDVLSAWTVAALISSLIGGFLGGVLLQAFHPPAAPPLRAILQGWIVAWLGLLFFAGRIAEALAQGGPMVGRFVASLGLWLLFSVSLGTAAFLSGVMRQKRNREKGKREEIQHQEDHHPGESSPH